MSWPIGLPIVEAHSSQIYQIPEHLFVFLGKVALRGALEQTDRVCFLQCRPHGLEYFFRVNRPYLNPHTPLVILNSLQGSILDIWFQLEHPFPIIVQMIGIFKIRRTGDVLRRHGCYVLSFLKRTDGEFCKPIKHGSRYSLPSILCMNTWVRLNLGDF